MESFSRKARFRSLRACSLGKVTRRPPPLFSRDTHTPPWRRDFLNNLIGARRDTVRAQKFCTPGWGVGRHAHFKERVVVCFAMLRGGIPFCAMTAQDRRVGNRLGGRRHVTHVDALVTQLCDRTCEYDEGATGAAIAHTHVTGSALGKGDRARVGNQLEFHAATLNVNCARVGDQGGNGGPAFNDDSAGISVNDLCVVEGGEDVMYQIV